MVIFIKTQEQKYIQSSKRCILAHHIYYLNFPIVLPKCIPFLLYMTRANDLWSFRATIQFQRRTQSVLQNTSALSGNFHPPFLDRKGNLLREKSRKKLPPRYSSRIHQIHSTPRTICTKALYFRSVKFIANTFAASR